MGSVRSTFGPGLVAAGLILQWATVSPAQTGDPRTDSSRAEARAVSAPLEPGDAIRVSAWREPELSGLYTIDETGHAVLPLLGPRRVTAIPAVQVKRRLLEEYAGQLRSPEIQILLLRRVKVIGAVREPGLYHVDPTMNLTDVIAQAGGSTREGRLTDVRIVRGDREIRWDLGDPAAITHEIRSGDQILVPERGWFARNGHIVVSASISALAILVSRLAF